MSKASVLCRKVTKEIGFDMLMDLFGREVDDDV